MDRPADAPPVPDARPDAPRPGDAPAVDAEPDAGCAIAAGVTPTLTGTDDLAQYPPTQQLAPGAMMGSDAAALAWDRSSLYVTVTSDAFTSSYQPLHVYLQTGTDFSAATPAQGKEYGGLVPALPFAPNYLVAVRRVSDSGTGPYDGVYAPANGWTDRTLALDALASADQRTLSVAVPWAALGGCPHAARLAVHVVHGVAANEWKDLVPATHTPWVAPGGGYYELDLTGSPAVASWTLR